MFEVVDGTLFASVVTVVGLVLVLLAAVTVLVLLLLDSGLAVLAVALAVVDEGTGGFSCCLLLSTVLFLPLGTVLGLTDGAVSVSSW